jgi:prophage maintenance system killer protein
VEPILDYTWAAAALYAGILRVHPFVDGNHRVGFVALSAALWSFGLPLVVVRLAARAVSCLTDADVQESESRPALTGM